MLRTAPRYIDLTPRPVALIHPAVWHAHMRAAKWRRARSLASRVVIGLLAALLFGTLYYSWTGMP